MTTFSSPPAASMFSTTSKGVLVFMILLFYIFSAPLNLIRSTPDPLRLAQGTSIAHSLFSHAAALRASYGPCPVAAPRQYPGDVLDTYYRHHEKIFKQWESPWWLAKATVQDAAKALRRLQMEGDYVCGYAGVEEIPRMAGPGLRDWRFESEVEKRDGWPWRSWQGLGKEGK